MAASTAARSLWSKRRLKVNTVNRRLPATGRLGRNSSPSERSHNPRGTMRSAMASRRGLIANPDNMNSGSGKYHHDSQTLTKASHHGPSAGGGARQGKKPRGGGGGKK